MTTERDPSGITPGPLMVMKVSDWYEILEESGRLVFEAYTEADSSAARLVPEMIAALRANDEAWRQTGGCHTFRSNECDCCVCLTRRILAQLDNADAPRIADCERDGRCDDE